MTAPASEPDPLPPPGCRWPLMWRLARGLYDAHAPGVDGLCCLCRPAELDPCPARKLAADGLRTACGHTQPPGGAAWFDVLRRRVRAGVVDSVDVPAEAIWLRRHHTGGE